MTICPSLLPLCLCTLPSASYIVVKGVGGSGSGSGGRGEAAAPPASLYELEFAVNVDGDSIDQSLAYLAER